MNFRKQDKWFFWILFLVCTINEIMASLGKTEHIDIIYLFLLIFALFFVSSMNNISDLKKEIKKLNDR